MMIAKAAAAAQAQARRISPFGPRGGGRGAGSSRGLRGQALRRTRPARATSRRWVGGFVLCVWRRFVCLVCAVGRRGQRGGGIRLLLPSNTPFPRKTTNTHLNQQPYQQQVRAYGKTLAFTDLGAAATTQQEAAVNVHTLWQPPAALAYLPTGALRACVRVVVVVVVVVIDCLPWLSDTCGKNPSLPSLM